MITDELSPDLELLSQEFVLIQAWKKTASYIRYHNWYSDTLELDRTAANLPRFLGELGHAAKQVNAWENTPLRMVPAPKSQSWRIFDGQWRPVKGNKTESKLRPLAHADLKSQVLATAIMMCVADRVESLQGDPRVAPQSDASERRVISYGNRLFCDKTPTGLRHRWGSSKLYRAYYQDYRNFIARPELIAKATGSVGERRVVIVHSDLRRFYDCVRPELLHKKLSAVSLPGDDPAFYELAGRVLSWSWDERDHVEVSNYSRESSIENFSSIALPQGLVSAGFFANVVLLDFDEELRSSLSTEMIPGIGILDAARYVDDLRIVLTVDLNMRLEHVEETVYSWLQEKLDLSAPALEVSREKTHAAALDGAEKPLVRQSRKMARIQAAVSGGFDALGGIEILDAVQGLIRSQQRYSEANARETGWAFAPVPDVRDATVARFAAGRYRATYRSLRPMLMARNVTQSDENQLVLSIDRAPDPRSQEDLDEEARAFALGLIEEWVEDPANVRLLRIGLDLWPSPEVLEGVLDLLRPFTTKNGMRKAPRRVAWYCLAEIFRAGATETGFVEDTECLPDGLVLGDYRHALAREGVHLLEASGAGLPWYLRQQILLFLAANNPTAAPIHRTGRSSETKHYRELVRFLRGEIGSATGADFATLAVLARRSFAHPTKAKDLALQDIGPSRLAQIAERDPSFVLELINARPELASEVTPRLRDDLCLQLRQNAEGLPSLADLVLGEETNGQLRNELSLLSFAFAFLANWEQLQELDAVSPTDVRIDLSTDQVPTVKKIQVVASRVSSAGSIYSAPTWCPPKQRWQFQLGFLLRFIMTAREDFTRPVREVPWRESEPTYRSGISHWYQRRYGLFNGHDAFGDDWMPVSEWMEHLLSALLRWPGSRTTKGWEFVEASPEVFITQIRIRLNFLIEKRGPNTQLLMIPVLAPRLFEPGSDRPLRACVVQTIIPGDSDFSPSDLSCSNREIRKRHRRHLSSALAAIERMLDLRETHKCQDRRLDWLIFPELSVHPDDVKTHLVPFARKHRTIILAGLTYEELFKNQPLINSALWIIPVWDEAHGLQVRVRRQGKQHLAPMEDSLNANDTVIQGFRPCQWLIGYQWTNDAAYAPLWLTSAICYDATDLALAVDLRDKSDVFAIPALNRDVGTFDQMSLALHYHMFQMVIVANNGLYGGSNAYAPYKEAYHRQVFHLHGQPQASIAFLEIEPVILFQQRKNKPLVKAVAGNQEPKAPQWKAPPAGLKV
jgi:hypothetical protein